MNIWKRVGVFVLLLLLMLPLVALTSDGATIDSWLIGGGGNTDSLDGNISLGSALGQAIAGRSSNGPLELQSGFWSGVGMRSEQVFTLFMPLILVGD